MIVFSTTVLGQSNPVPNQQTFNLKNVIPPSPNASSLGKYADWPVSMFTGVPQISLPVYEFKGRSVSIPIRLNYHGSGIKVGETASSVGLGWSLEAGGAVTRSVRGLPDNGGYLTTRQYYNNPADLSSGTTTASMDSTLSFGAAKGDVDTDPDIFMFNALGRSFNFFFTGTGAVVTQPYSNIKITVNTDFSQWTVIFEDGTKLLLGGAGCVETTSTTRTSSYTSSWLLKSITAINGEVVNFTYSSACISQDSFYYQADYLWVSGQMSDYQPAIFKGEVGNTCMLTPLTIESDLCRIDFDTAARIDLAGAKAIVGIKVYSKLKSNYIKTYKLYYNNSVAVSSNGYTLGEMTSAGYRQKLTFLEEIPSDNSQHKFWAFQYNPLNLPSRKSFAQDYWGYYNGATSNTGLLPAAPGFNPDQYAISNRSSDSASMMAEILTQIAYPTGGYSKFNYEPNSYPATEEKFANVSNNLHLYLTSGQTGFTNTQSVTLVVTKAQYFKFQFRGVFSAVYAQDYGASTVLASAVLKNSSNTTISSLTLNKNQNSTTYTSSSVLLNPGTYTFTMSSISPQGDFSSTSQNVDLTSSYVYAGSLGMKLVNHPVGGVRIRSIFDYDQLDTARAVKKYYQYEGASVIWPVNADTDYLTPTTFVTSNCFGSASLTATYNERNSSTRFSLGDIQGGTVGYTKVTVKNGPNAENGKTVYYYSFDYDLNLAAAQAFPYPPLTSVDWRRGLLLGQYDFTAANLLIAKTRNNFQFVNKGSIKTYREAYKFNVPSSCYAYTSMSQMLARAYYVINSEQVQQSASITTSYAANGDSLINTTNYFYDNVNNMQPTRTTMSNSKSASNNVTLYSRTALEKSDIHASISLGTTASSALDAMLARNMLGAVESEKYVNGTVTSKTLTNYKLQTSNLITQDQVVVQNLTNTAEARLLFNSFDSNGNLLEQQKPGDAKEVFLYGYQGQYPVAKISGSDYSTAQALIVQATLTNAANFTDAAVRTELNKLRVSLPSALVSTYTYAPLIGITSETDPKGYTVFYEYDGYGRLARVRDMDNNIVKQYQYQYFGPQMLYYNTIKSGVFTRNNCGTGFTGSSVTYTVPAGTYSSSVNQAAADALATSAVSAGGQAYANANGTCTGASITLSAVNSTGLSGFTATYTNTGTSVQTVFSIPASGGTIGSLTAGTYTVLLAKTGNSSTKYIYGVCGTTHASAVTSTFTSVNVSSSCNSLSVDTID